MHEICPNMADPFLQFAANFKMAVVSLRYIRRSMAAITIWHWHTFHVCQFHEFVQISICSKIIIKPNIWQWQRTWHFGNLCKQLGKLVSPRIHAWIIGENHSKYYAFKLQVFYSLILTSSYIFSDPSKKQKTNSQIVYFEVPYQKMLQAQFALHFISYQFIYQSWKHVLSKSGLVVGIMGLYVSEP